MAAQQAAGESSERAASQYERYSDRVEGAARAAVERGKELGESVQGAADNLRRVADSSVRNQPLTTLAVVAVLGFALGALWKK
jgi:ElaB/YqjD/DUF883 family membrane-anchored ribosome-binding protein